LITHKAASEKWADLEVKLSSKFSNQEKASRNAKIYSIFAQMVRATGEADTMHEKMKIEMNGPFGKP
jgi:hypothetical protein